MLARGFRPKFERAIRPAKPAPAGTPRRDVYLISVYDYPDDWKYLPKAEVRLRLMLTRVTLRQMGIEDGSMMVFSFWPDTIMLKEIGDPLAIADYLDLNDRNILARNILSQGRQNTNYAITLYACHPFFVQGVATMTNGENTAFVPIREFLMCRNFPGYVGYQSDSEFRQIPRVSFCAPCQVETVNSSFSGTTRDVSYGGLSVQFAPPLQESLVGTILHLQGVTMKVFPVETTDRPTHTLVRFRVDHIEDGEQRWRDLHTASWQ